jgi:hypothetical protein
LSLLFCFFSLGEPFVFHVHLVLELWKSLLVPLKIALQSVEDLVLLLPPPLSRFIPFFVFQAVEPLPSILSFKGVLCPSWPVVCSPFPAAV